MSDSKLNISDHYEGQSLIPTTEEESSPNLATQKMELPSFNGSAARAWLARLEQNFLVHKIPAAMKGGACCHSFVFEGCLLFMVDSEASHCFVSITLGNGL